MGETRVNLKHLLEDLRDTYPWPAEEAIVTELIANALDSGASQIRFLSVPTQRTFSVVDNGTGMKKADLEGYHDIAATTKVRGKGIGFAGLGVKLSLILAEAVLTETKGPGFHGATQWCLAGPRHAPWREVPPPGLVNTGTGTAVAILLHDSSSDLLDPAFVDRVIKEHFYPLLDREFAQVLSAVYKSGITFSVNEAMVAVRPSEESEHSNLFLVTTGRKTNPVGIGFIRKGSGELPEEQRGIAVSTYGKVIKRGWDWVGLTPRHPTCLTGVVEIPALAEILTTNKADFLKDAASLQKYYRYRKAAQEAMEPILRRLGELAPERERVERDLRPLEREIEQAIGRMLDEFPELGSLLGRRGRGEAVKGIIPDEGADPVGINAEGVESMTGTRGGSGTGAGVPAATGGLPGEHIEVDANGAERGTPHAGRLRRASLMIGFEDDPVRKELGWLLESTIWINRSHPAFKRAVAAEAESYHIVLTVAWVLSCYVEAEKSPQSFVNKFLATWGSGL